jgi:rhomboid family protein
VMLIGWIILQLVGEFASITDAASGGVAYMAHIGGFLAGVILTMVLSGRRLALPTA